MAIRPVSASLQSLISRINDLNRVDVNGKKTEELNNLEQQRQDLQNQFRDIVLQEPYFQHEYMQWKDNTGIIWAPGGKYTATGKLVVNDPSDPYCFPTPKDYYQKEELFKREVQDRVPKEVDAAARCISQIIRKKIESAFQKAQKSSSRPVSNPVPSLQNRVQATSYIPASQSYHQSSAPAHYPQPLPSWATSNYPQQLPPLSPQVLQQLVDAEAQEKARAGGNGAPPLPVRALPQPKFPALTVNDIAQTRLKPVSKNPPKPSTPKISNQNEKEAQLALGKALLHGTGMKKNEAEAIQYFLKLAQEGYHGAEYQLGYCYYYGLGISQDLVKAAEWLRKAANGNLPDAQYLLGYLCSTRLISKTNSNAEKALKNDPESFRWLEKAAQQNHLDAICTLGHLNFEMGRLSEAKNWYQKAADLGNNFARQKLQEIQFQANSNHKTASSQAVMLKPTAKPVANNSYPEHSKALANLDKFHKHVIDAINALKDEYSSYSHYQPYRAALIEGLEAICKTLLFLRTLPAAVYAPFFANQEERKAFVHAIHINGRKGINYHIEIFQEGIRALADLNTKLQNLSKNNNYSANQSTNPTVQESSSVLDPSISLGVIPDGYDFSSISSGVSTPSFPSNATTPAPSLPTPPAPAAAASPYASMSGGTPGYSSQPASYAGWANPYMDSSAQATRWANPYSSGTGGGYASPYTNPGVQASGWANPYSSGSGSGYANPYSNPIAQGSGYANPYSGGGASSFGNTGIPSSSVASSGTSSPVAQSYQGQTSYGPSGNQSWSGYTASPDGSAGKFYTVIQQQVPSSGPMPPPVNLNNLANQAAPSPAPSHPNDGQPGMWALPAI